MTTIAILPEKHVRVTESLLGIGALVLPILKSKPRTIDSVWNALKYEESIRDRINGSVSFDTVILAVDVLFAMGLIDLDDEGRLCICD